MEDDEQVSDEDGEQVEEEEGFISDELWAIRESKDVVERVDRRFREDWHEWVSFEILLFASGSLEMTRK